MSVRVLFLGTPDFALPTLDALHGADGITVCGVLTQPDRRAGRGKKMRPAPVKVRAVGLGLDVLSPESLKDDGVFDWISGHAPDAIVVVAYGGFVGKKIREVSRMGCVNLHPSLLPRYRGAAPIQWAIMNGDTKTGNSTMYLSKGWDDGDVIYQEEEEIYPDDTYGSLSERLSQKGAALIVKSLRDIEAGTAPRTPQPEEGVVMAPMIANEDCTIDWSRAAQEIHNQIRGMNPTPSAFTTLNGERMKVFRSRVIEMIPQGEPGTVLNTSFDTLRVAADDRIVELLEIQPAGKRRMVVGDFLRGHPVEAGTRLGS